VRPSVVAEARVRGGRTIAARAVRPARERNGGVFELGVNGWSIVGRTLIVYVALLVAIRLAGKREMGQMTAFDLVVILLIANAVQNAMVGTDSSVTGGLIAAGVLIGANMLIARVRHRVPWLRRGVEGSPTLLITDGHFLEANLRSEGVDREEVLMAIREHGLEGEAAVRMAVLETDGSVSVIPIAAPVVRTRRRMRARKR
jgi:uncharacterized membrane protein YcaP (DUF421 family)